MCASIDETDINNFFGDMDLFLIDQILKGHLGSWGKVLDVGCGSGRNMVYFLNKRWQVWGIDTDESQLQLLRYLFKSYPHQDAERLLSRSVENTGLESASFDLVICSRVFHHLDVPLVMPSWTELHRVLKPEGVLYFSMNSTINFESHLLTHKTERQFKDGTIGTFLTTALLEEMETLGYQKLMPHRTVHFDDQHAETTLILKKT
ncbi:MAG: class I SAM-dependent methyltransferase [Bacteroidota bacterium]